PAEGAAYRPGVVLAVHAAHPRPRPDALRAARPAGHRPARHLGHEQSDRHGGAEPRRRGGVRGRDDRALGSGVHEGRGEVSRGRYDSGARPWMPFVTRSAAALSLSAIRSMSRPVMGPGKPITNSAISTSPSGPNTGDPMWFAR